MLAINTERARDPFAGVDPGVRALVDRLRAHVLAGKGAYVPKGFEEAVRVPSPPEGERVLLPRGTPIYGEDGTVAGAAIVLQDITRLFRFDELKNDLVATVAHEFRTPLTSLRMALHLCTEEAVGPLTPKQADLLFAAREDCERLQVIVDELLNLSRIESGTIELHRRRTDPGRAGRHGGRAASRRGRAGAGHDPHRGAARPRPRCSSIPTACSWCSRNLLTNAIRFAPRDSEIVVRARAEAARADAGSHRAPTPTHIRFEVADRGPGIPAEHQAGLFEKFFRVPGSPEGGLGPGPVHRQGRSSRRTAARSGSTSEPGQGATFWFTVPVVAPAA